MSWLRGDGQVVYARRGETWLRVQLRRVTADAVSYSWVDDDGQVHLEHTARAHLESLIRDGLVRPEPPSPVE